VEPAGRAHSERVHAQDIRIYLSISYLSIHNTTARTRLYIHLSRLVNHRSSSGAYRATSSRASSHISLSIYLSIYLISIYAYYNCLYTLVYSSLTPFEPQVKLWSLQGDLLASEFTHKTSLFISLSISSIYIYIYYNCL